MRRKIAIYIILATLVIACAPSVNAVTVATADVGISNLNWAMEAQEGQGTLYLWWTINDAAKETQGLQVNISVDGSNIGTTSANGHLNLQSAWTFTEFGAVFDTTGTYTIKVEFVDFTEPEGSNTANNKVERTVSVGQGILDDILNGIYGIYFAVGEAIPQTGIGLIDDLPFLPIIILIVIVIIIYILYRKRKKKKKAKPMKFLSTPPHISATMPFQHGTQRHPPYGPPREFDEYY